MGDSQIRAERLSTRRTALLGGVGAAVALALTSEAYVGRSAGRSTQQSSRPFAPRGATGQDVIGVEPQVGPVVLLADGSAAPTNPGTAPLDRQPGVSSGAGSGTARTRTTGRVWSAPVYSLGEYAAHFPQTTFPRDAVMLTIDDGPDATWTPKILRLLSRHQVQATFCIIGEQAHRYPHLVRAIASEGHHVANHTFTHPLVLPRLSRAGIKAQVVDTQDAITRAAGVTPRLFRAPGGNWGRDVYTQIATHNLVPVDWDVDPRDWSRPGTAHIVRDLLTAHPGQILLCHDGGGDRSQTYAALSTVLPELTGRGLQFVTLPA